MHETETIGYSEYNGREDPRNRRLRIADSGKHYIVYWALALSFAIIMLWYSAFIYSIIQWGSAGALVCTGNDFSCDGGSQCLAPRRRCDGSADCADGSDEASCAGGSRVCPAGQTPCRDHRVCVHLDWRCDGVANCPDGSDEFDCGQHRHRRCGPGQLQCRGEGLCLDVLYRCDSDANCEDGSDEIGCAAPASPCGSDGFWCPHRSFCIAASQHCNGHNDCGDGYDELGCNATCAPGEMRCETMCIEASWVCDGNPDCADGRDEVDCPTPEPPQPCSADQFSCDSGLCIPEEDHCDGHQDCEAGEDERDCEPVCAPELFPCPDGTCLPQQQVCDGVRQCAWGHDEDGCAHLAQCPLSAHCKQLCLGLPSETAPNCTCRQGYALQPDRISCEDVDECRLSRPCSHQCQNLNGSYQCSCAEGYELRSDGQTCRAGPPPASLLLADKYAIEQLTVNGALAAVAHKGLANAVYLDFHLSLRLLFWMDTAQNAIYRSPMAGSSPPVAVVYAGLSHPVGLVVDWLHDLLYWADEQQGVIEVSQLDGRRRAVITERLEGPRALCLHPQRALLFWTDISSEARIERVHGDGGGRQLIVSGELLWPNGLTIDYPTDRLYWNDAKLNSISSCGLDGSDRRQVLRRGAPHPYGLTLFEDTLFWTDWKTHALHAADKRHGEHARLLRSGLEQPMDVRAVHPLRQPGERRYCLPSNGCSDLCLPRPDGQTCACPSGLRLVTGSDSRCESEPAGGLVVAANGSIQVAPLSGGRWHLVPLLGAGRPSAAAADHRHTLFWADADGGCLRSALWNGTRHRCEVDANLGNVTGVAVDWLSGLLYWVDAGLQRLEVVRTDGLYRRLLLSDGIDSPTALQLHPTAGVMFWSDLGGVSGSSARIERAAMDGSGRSVLISGQLGAPTGLALDAAASTIFWCDAKLGTVSSALLTSSGGVEPARTLYSGQDRPAALAAAAGRLYWLLSGSETVLNGTASGAGPPPATLATALGSPLALALLGAGDGADSAADRPTAPCGSNNGQCSHLCLPTPDGPVCRCPTGVPMSSDGRTCQAGPALSLVFSRGWEVRRLSLTEPPSVDTVLPLPRSTHVTALAWDPRTDRLLYADAAGGQRHITSTSMDGLKSHVVIAHELENVADIAIDNIGSKLYWTDMSRASIEVCSLDGGLRQLVVHTGLSSPRALVLSHQHGLLFWSDWGQRSRIERAWMDGSHRSVVASERIGRPCGLVVDAASDRLLWADHQLGTIESAALDGSQRSTLASELSGPAGLAFHHGRLYWTEEVADGGRPGAGSVRSRDASDSSGQPETLTQPLDNLGHILVLERDAAMLRYVCGGGDNGGCAGLCLRTPTGRSCRCGTGLRPAEDGAVCPDRPDQMLLYVTLNSVARVSLDVRQPWEVTLPVTDVHNAAHLDFVAADNAVVYTDRRLNEIRVADVRTPPVVAPRTLLAAADIWPEGVAVDWAARLVFYTEARGPTVSVVALNGCCRRRLVTDGLSRPRALAVWPPAGLLVWVDQEGPPRIEASRMDGSDRRHLVTERLTAPTGLALEQDRMYWADAERHTIESADLAGGDRRVLVPDAHHPFGVTVLGDWLYWSDWGTHSLERVGKVDGGRRSTIRSKLDRIMDVVAVSASRQAGSSPCALENGGCSHLCLYRGSGSLVCACPDTSDDRPCRTTPHYQSQPSTAGGISNVSTALLASGGLLLLLLIVLVAVLFRRSRLAQRAPDREATLTFSNPTYNSSASDFSSEKRFSWRKAKYDRAQEPPAAGQPSGTAGLEAAALIDGVMVDHNSSTPLASSPGLQH